MVRGFAGEPVLGLAFLDCGPCRVGVASSSVSLPVAFFAGNEEKRPWLCWLVLFIVLMLVVDVGR